SASPGCDTSRARSLGRRRVAPRPTAGCQASAGHSRDAGYRQTQAAPLAAVAGRSPVPSRSLAPRPVRRVLQHGAGRTWRWSERLTSPPAAARWAREGFGCRGASPPSGRGRVVRPWFRTLLVVGVLAHV